MAQKKKLQVFISSTYSDLKEERQAAVEAILTAGHIPAGMELFAAGDESQMNVIKRWIDESDVYMLILGGRYGSIEPKSSKSYIELEYEYAVEKYKPLFSVVITEEHLNEKVRENGLHAIEQDHSEMLKEFRELVCSKMVRFWNDPKDIKLAIMETMSDFSHRTELIGWIPGSEAINSGAIAEQIARLSNENSQLREQLTNSQTSEKYGGLTFNEMLSLLTSVSATDISGMSENYFGMNLTVMTARYQKIVELFSDTEPNLLHFYWMLSRRFSLSMNVNAYRANSEAARLNYRLLNFGLIERIDTDVRGNREIRHKLSESGRKFLNRLRIERQLTRAEELVL